MKGCPRFRVAWQTLSIPALRASELFCAKRVSAVGVRTRHRVETSARLHMTSKMPECSCRGGNPSCFKCGGWGGLETRVHLIGDRALVSSRHRRWETKAFERRLPLAARNATAYSKYHLPNLQKRSDRSRSPCACRASQCRNQEAYGRFFARGISRLNQCGALVRSIRRHPLFRVAQRRDGRKFDQHLAALKTPSGAYLSIRMRLARAIPRAMPSTEGAS